jgi:hypothetical protein
VGALSSQYGFQVSKANDLRSQEVLSSRGPLKSKRPEEERAPKFELQYGLSGVHSRELVAFLLAWLDGPQLITKAIVEGSLGRTSSVRAQEGASAIRKGEADLELMGPIGIGDESDSRAVTQPLKVADLLAFLCPHARIGAGLGRRLRLRIILGGTTGHEGQEYRRAGGAGGGGHLS